ncbi:hypothetical protein FCI23_26310 [Actinacidiphila oryziradicis]|uniref:Transposase putative helix-turn-helix domain-containing protein n=1 Tax=Actinacidiphila oryziradicis TaxID=2571141 RepID=A0A4U0SIL5_9ACTN|nr:hypothetical protein FCI23_26310 [Actinacidiphila oryziradicis]
MQLRYNYFVYPDALQCRALAAAFGCARVVWNDCLRARREAQATGPPYVTLAAGRADRLNASQSAGKTRTKIPAQRVEAGSHQDGHKTVAGIPGLADRGARQPACPRFTHV